MATIVISSHGLYLQSFSIMSGDTVTAILPGARVDGSQAKVITVPVNITAHIHQ